MNKDELMSESSGHRPRGSLGLYLEHPFEMVYFKSKRHKKTHANTCNETLQETYYKDAREAQNSIRDTRLL